MKIALLGYGKMGREVEQTALERSHEILLKIDSQAEIDAVDLSKAEVAIDFSMPSSASYNILKCFDVNVPIVVGTTGWSDKLEDIKQVCLEKSQALFYASNFSIGVNIFFELNRKLAQMMNEHTSYDVSIEETHHTEKLDAPSGTAITLANDITVSLDRKSKWVNKESTADTDIQITSIRKDDVTGTHIVKYFSDIDGIEIKHEANSRKGFAMGAVIAAEWIIGKQGVFTMQDFLKL